VGVLAAGCHKSAVVTTRAVTAYVPEACAADGGAFVEYLAYGDFEPPAAPATGHLLGAVGTALPEIDTQARELVVTASEGSSAWEGLGPMPASGDVSVLLLPTLTSCPLTQGVGARAGSVIAPIGGERVLVVGGTGQTVPSTYFARLDTGEVDALTQDLQTPRTFASVTAFGDGALVAGGVSPAGVLSNAEVYSASSGGFTSAPIALSGPRAQHGAVVLASGQTLLVGGLSSSDPGSVLASMEIVDPVLGKSIAEGVGQLTYPRSNPTVLRLASGEILVAGGLDGHGEPVPWLEWFNPFGAPEAPGKQPIALAQGKGSVFVALEAGGALAVLMPPATPAPAGFQNVYVVDATGALDVAAPVTGTLTTPALFGGAQGSPVLWTGDRWLQWQPYAGAFGALDVLDDVPAAISPQTPTCAPDPGLAMWLDAAHGDALTLLRFDTRNAYSSLPGPLLATGTAETAPDRLQAAVWSADDGTLTLPPGTPGAGVFVTDRTYADVTIQLTAPTGQTALVVLRDDAGNELEVPGASCSGVWAAGDASTTLTVQRAGASVTWSADGQPPTACTVPFEGSARVSVGVRAGTSMPGVVSQFIVTRAGTP
jgi:hypothetical protein